MPAPKTFARTAKQKEIMRLVIAATCSGEDISAGDLKSRLSYGAEVSKQAVYCSIKFLEKHGLLNKEIRGSKAMLTPTERGLALYGPRPDPEPSSD